MDTVLKQTLESLGKSPTLLIGRNTDKIKTLFPIPKEQKILWADVNMGRRPTGLVLTNQGLFIKGSSHVLKRINEKKKKKEKVNSIYHYVKWEFFSPEDFVCDKNGEVIDVSYNNRLVLELTGMNFFQAYTDIYTKFIKESAVSAADVFADVESVKAVSDVYSPVSGTVAEVNEELLDSPQLVNEDPYGAWFIKVENGVLADELLTAAEYEEVVKQEQEG